jgi:hypothetical protein
MKVGQTHAIAAMKNCLKNYGRNTLITALQCITKTSDGNPGFVRATIVEALCSVLHNSPEWREAGDLLLRAMDDFDFADAGRNDGRQELRIVSCSCESLRRQNIQSPE